MENSIFRSGSYTWWQLGFFKLSLLSFGIAIGAYWQDMFLPYLSWLVAAGAALGLYLIYAWFRK